MSEQMHSEQAVYDPYAPRKIKQDKCRTNEKQKTAPMREEGTEVGSVAAGQLRAFIERIERVHEDKKALSEDEKMIFAELKGAGFDTKAVRAIIRMRKKELHELQEEQAMIDLYCSALGMPLFGGGDDADRLFHVVQTG